MFFKKLSGLVKNKSLSTSEEALLEALYEDVSNALIKEEVAADVEITVSTKTKTIKVIINDNKKLTINYTSKNNILNNNKNWEKKIKDVIAKQINKSSFKAKYVVSMEEKYSLSDLNLLNVDLTINDVLSERTNAFICYATKKEIEILLSTNQGLIKGAIEDELVSIPDNEIPNDEVNSLSRSISINSYLKRIGADTSSRRVGTRNPDFDISKSSNDKSPNPIRVFVFDTGISKHPDITINYELSKDFTSDEPSDWYDRNGHGTHVAGTIGANDNDEVSGVAPNIEVIAYKVLGDNGSGSISQIFKAFDDVASYKKNNPHSICIINMSLGGDKGNDNKFFEIYSNNVKKLIDQGIIIIVAAGNERVNVSTKVPADVPYVITVGAYNDTNNQLAPFSNFGEKVDILAPGVGIKNTWLNGLYKSIDGTSMATPIITGAVVNMVAVSAKNEKILDQEDVRKILKNNGIDANNDGRNPFITLTPTANSAKTTSLSVYVGEYMKKFSNY